MSVNDDLKQQRLEEESQIAIEKAGGHNFLQAEFYRKFAERAIGNDEPILSRVQPDININMNNEAWRQAVCVTLAYLKRFKMEESIATLRTEFKDTPNKSGFSKKADLEEFFEDVANVIIDKKSQSLEKRVALFSDEAGLPPPKHIKKDKKSHRKDKGSHRPSKN